MFSVSKNLADNIVALRKKHGLSQEQFAEKIGVTRQAVSNWECRIATPDVETLDLIAKLFDADLTALVNGESTAAEKPKDKMTFSKNEYLICPCKVSSIPYWKSKSITVPDGMCIVHKDNFNKTEYQHYIDEPYFRLIHSLQDLSIQVLPQGYLLYNATLKDFAEHINSCYSGICVTEADLRDYTARPVYDSSLWLAIKNNQTDEVVATGIAELDKEVGEGVLEWIQVAVVANKDKAAGIPICGQAMLQIIQNSAGVLLLLVCGCSALRVWLHLYGFHLKHDHIPANKGANGRRLPLHRGKAHRKVQDRHSDHRRHNGVKEGPCPFLSEVFEYLLPYHISNAPPFRDAFAANSGSISSEPHR